MRKDCRADSGLEGTKMLSRLKELYDYREMIRSLIRRELRGKYKASVLGFLWTFLNPLFQLFVYTIVFSVILRSGIEDFYLYLFIGLVPWNFFHTSVSGGASCVVCQENLIKKIYFPRMALPVAYVTGAFINMLLTSMITFLFLLAGGHGFCIRALFYLPLVALIEYIFAIGMCMIVSALDIFFRDMEYILGIITMAWMYLTPVMYTMEMIPQEMRGIFLLNPMTAMIRAYQDILYYKKVPEIETLATATVLGLCFCVAGFAVFERLQRKFAEEL